jgi:predicted  nucleic acid-binding Zn-ribbon protein
MIVVDEDNQYLIMQMLKQKNKDYLLKHYQYLKNVSTENEYLKELCDEYRNDYDELLEEKKQQKKAIQNLLKYLEDMDSNILLTNEAVKEARVDRNNIKKKIKEILTEINKIKKLQS